MRVAFFEFSFYGIEERKKTMSRKYCTLNLFKFAHYKYILPPFVIRIDLYHGLINFKDTKPSMSSLLVFIRVYRLEIQSVMLAFSTGPSNLLFG